MNHFILDKDINQSVRYHCDKHVIKLALEATQVVSTVRHKLGKYGPYPPTHENHPVVVWTHRSKENYLWMCNYGIALCDEYTFRYGKEHACEILLRQMRDVVPDNLASVGLTTHYLCMPYEYKSKDVVESYRNYYYYDKFKNIAMKWTKRLFPGWILERHNCETTTSNC